MLLKVNKSELCFSVVVLALLAFVLPATAFAASSGVEVPDFSGVSVTDLGFMDTVIRYFRDYSVYGYKNLSGAIRTLAVTLAIIDCGTCFYLYTSGIKWEKLVARVMKVSAVLMVIGFWPDITDGLLESAKALGAVAGSGSYDTANGDWLTVKSIMGMAAKASNAIFSAMGSSYLSLITGIPTLVGIIGVIFIYLSFGYMAFMYSFCYIEFYVFATLAFVLLPFGMLGFMRQKFSQVLDGMLSLGVKMMVFVFMLAVYQSFWSKLALNIREDGFIGSVLGGCVTCSVLCFMFGKVPQLASSLVSGSGDWGMGSGGTAGGIAGGIAAVRSGVGKAVAGASVGAAMLMAYNKNAGDTGSAATAVLSGRLKNAGASFGNLVKNPSGDSFGDRAMGFGRSVGRVGTAAASRVGVTVSNAASFGYNYGRASVKDAIRDSVSNFNTAWDKKDQSWESVLAFRGAMDAGANENGWGGEGNKSVASAPNNKTSASRKPPEAEEIPDIGEYVNNGKGKA